MKLPALFASLLVSAHCLAEPEALSIKGYKIGAAMDACPAATYHQERQPNGVHMCLLQDTYAGLNVTLIVGYRDGKVTLANVQRPPGSGTHHNDLDAALRERWGPPTETHRYPPRSFWRRAGATLVFNGRDGSVMLLDEAAERERRRARAADAKDDM